MYRLIVVDDESIVREGISSVVPWKENGFELVGLFENGEAALGFVENHPVDVVISDINMPRMDGLELAGRLARDFPSILVLLLTGYDDFEYAQEAVRHRVMDYLLKPITAKELGDVLQSVRDRLDAATHQRRQEEALRERLRKSFPLLRERFLRRLIQGGVPAADRRRQFEYFGWEDRRGWYVVVCAAVPGDWDEMRRIALAERAEEVLVEGDEQFTDGSENQILLLQGIDGEEVADRAADAGRILFRFAARSSDEGLPIGLGEPVETLDRLALSYATAKNAAGYARVLGAEQVLSSEDIRGRETFSPDEFNALVSEVVATVREREPGEGRAALDRAFAYLERHYLSGDEVRYCYASLDFALYSLGRDIDLGGDGAATPFTAGSFESNREAREHFTQILGDLEQRLAARRQDAALSRIDRAKSLIESRYADSSFSLQDMCDELYLSVSRFSTLFKEGTGRTFIEYLTAYRVSKARELLKNTDMKTYEVAEAVGYTDPRYFSLIFKKVTGQTAREYQRSLES